MGEGTEECHPTQRTPRHCSLDLSTDVLIWEFCHQTIFLKKKQKKKKVSLQVFKIGFLGHCVFKS